MKIGFAFTTPWRDELTPRSRSSRRRWAVALAALLLLAGASARSPDLADALGGDGNGRGLLLLIAGLVIFGVLQRGTRRLGSLRSGDGDLDERDLASRHRAFRTAFALFLVVLFATLILLPGTLPEGTHRVAGGRQTGGSYLDGGSLLNLGYWLFAWAVFLPTAALAWREPDAPPLDEDEIRPVLGEGPRDVLLAATIVLGGAVAALAPDGDASLLSLVVPLVPFVLFACALASVRARRAGVRPIPALFRGWRIATALALEAAILIALGVTTGGSGDSAVERVADRGPGIHEVHRETTGPDGEQVGELCYAVVSRGGSELTGRAARREARRLGRSRVRLCP